MTISVDSCPICSQMLDGRQCPNWLCADPTRSIERIRAIAYSSGELRSKIHRYKYDGKRGWSLIFGRLLVAWLDRNGNGDPPDLVVANPTFTASGSARRGHTERVIVAAANEDLLGEWPFDVGDPPAIIKTRETEKSAGKSTAAKRDAASELRETLAIPDRRTVEGRCILVYDDVCTTGGQLNAVAACLIEDGGATSVEGVVPYHPSSLAFESLKKVVPRDHGQRSPAGSMLRPPTQAASLNLGSGGGTGGTHRLSTAVGQESGTFRFPDGLLIARDSGPNGDAEATPSDPRSLAPQVDVPDAVGPEVDALASFEMDGHQLLDHRLQAATL